MQISGTFFPFLLSLWFSALHILALSASNGSHLCVGSCFLCCGPGHGFTLKARGLTGCAILVFHLSRESQSRAGSWPTLKHICFLYFVQICVVYGRQAIPKLVSQSQPEAEVSCLLILIFLLYFPQKHIIKQFSTASCTYYSLFFFLNPPSAPYHLPKYLAFKVLINTRNWKCSPTRGRILN